MKKVAVLQSNYIPWKGYFDIIHDVDLFVFYDDVQYTHRDWRNRNKIMTKNGTLWLTVPVKANRDTLIYQAEISNDDNKKWRQKHYNTIKYEYGKSEYFNKYKDFLEYIYMEKEWDRLTELNQYIIKFISKEILKIKTEFADSRQFAKESQKHEKLLSLVKNTGADFYLSGPAAKDYIISEDYKKANIQLAWKNYSGYPEYKQFNYEFNHNVSILDLLFHTGDDAPYYIWGWRTETDKSYYLD